MINYSNDNDALITNHIGCYDRRLRLHFPEPISKFCSITKFFFAIHLLYLLFNFSDEIKRFWDILDVIGYF